ncbi:MAG: hypothetical protein ACP5IO_00975 [Elusimicrobiales bacterium]
MEGFLFYIFFIFADLFASEDLSSIYLQGVKQWLDGRIDDAIGSFEYVVHNSTDNTLILKAGKDLITLLNSKAESSLALAYSQKLEAINSTDSYILFEKAYSQMIIGDYVKAEKTFDDIMTTTDDEDVIYVSRFFNSIVKSKLSGYEKAISELIGVLKNYKPLLAPSSYLLSIYYLPYRKMASINFLKDLLTYDPKNIQGLIDLAELYKDTKYYLQAWQAYYTLREIEGTDSYADSKAKKLIKKIDKDPNDLFFWSRIAWPVHEKPLSTISLTPIRIAIYANKKKHYPLLSFYIISNSDFEIRDATARRFQGKRNMQYQIIYLPEIRQLDIRDNYSSVLFSTRKNIEVKPNLTGGVILIKSPQIKQDLTGVNRGDRELSGNLSVDVSSDGMRIINQTYIEHILPSIVQGLPGPKRDDEAIKSLIITIRTMLLRRLNSSLDYDITDGDELIEFKGLQFEKESVIKLAEETKNIVLKKGSQLYPASYSLNTANIINSVPHPSSSFPQLLSPSSLDEWLFFKILKKTSYSTPLDPLELSTISWMLILKPYWIEERINTKYRIGKIKNIVVLKRDSIGKVISIKIEGSAGDAIIEGEREVNHYIAAGTIRSNLFTIRQVRKNNFPEFFILKGIGTGSFSGLCIYGADYLARNMNWKYKEILKYYFPDAEISYK